MDQLNSNVPNALHFQNLCVCVCVCVCVPMPTHCTIMRFGFHARQIDGIKCGLFSHHALLGQVMLPGECLSVFVY